MVKLNESLVLARSRASYLDSVRKLNCWGSQLTDVSILRKLSNVIVVSLSVNQIHTLADFAYCTNLEELYIRKNSIRDLSEICHLKKLPKLRVLWLADNPCSLGNSYRNTVLKTLPNLQKLDNVLVAEADINEALERGEELKLGEQQAEMSAASTNGVSTASARAASSAAAGAPPSEEEAAAAAEEEEAAAAAEEEVSNTAEFAWQETNKIRLQLGLKPISVEKAALPMIRPPNSSPKHRNANVLQAALCLVKELDGESLELLAQAIRERLNVL